MADRVITKRFITMSLSREPEDDSKRLRHESLTDRAMLLLARESVAFLGKLYTAATAIGGGFILLYLLQIRFVPQMGPASLTLAFIAAAGLGLAMLATLGGSPLLVSLLWRETLRIPRIDRSFRSSGRAETKRIVVLWFFFPVCAALLLWLGCTFFEIGFEGRRLIGLAFVAVLYGLLVFRRDFEPSEALLLIVVLAFSFVIAWAVWGLWTLTALDVLETRSVAVQWLIFSALTVWIPLIAAMATTEVGELGQTGLVGRSVLWTAFAIGLGLVYVVAMLGFTGLNSQLMARLGIGGMTGYTVVLTPEGGQVAQAAGISCDSMKAERAGGHCVVRNVRVLWLAGDEYLLGIPTEAGGERVLRLPRSRTLGIVRGR